MDGLASACADSQTNEIQAVTARHSLQEQDKAMTEGVRGGGTCLRALALPKDMDGLAGRVPS
jgi:hypothetical protein